MEEDCKREREKREREIGSGKMGAVSEREKEN